MLSHQKTNIFEKISLILSIIFFIFFIIIFMLNDKNIFKSILFNADYLKLNP